MLLQRGYLKKHKKTNVNNELYELMAEKYY